jgi:hypothetical protein
VPYLPGDLQELARNPPDLSRPETLVTLFRAVAPYTQFLLILVVLYVIWALVTGFIGYMSRFMRFCFRIGPVVAVVAWIMAASGQGGIDVLFEALKQYAGLANPDQHPRGAPPRRTPGWETPGTGSSYSSRSNRRSGRGSDSDSSTYYDPRSKTTSRKNRDKNANAQPDPMLASIIEDGLSATVQGYVKQAIARAAGLEWLVGGPQQQPAKEASSSKDKRRDDRSRYSR